MTEEQAKQLAEVHAMLKKLTANVYMDRRALERQGKKVALQDGAIADVVERLNRLEEAAAE